MAMMRYGRTNKMTSPPDKVVKNKDGTTTTTSGKTSVTMSDWIKPEKTPAPKGYISEDDYNAIEAKRKEVITKKSRKTIKIVWIYTIVNLKFIKKVHQAKMLIQMVYHYKVVKM